jgi:hypothetical protein
MPTKILRNNILSTSFNFIPNDTVMPPLIGSTEAAPAASAGTQEETLAMVIHNEGKGNDKDCCGSTDTNTERIAMSLSVQADGSAANDTATSASTRLTGPINTWDGLVQQKLQHQLQACIDENNPSPSKLIYGTLPTLLKQVSLFESVESKQLETIVHTLLRQGILLPYASLLALIDQPDGDPASSTMDTAQKLRTLQVQAMVRLQLWSIFGDAFVELYASTAVTDKVQGKGKNKKKQKKKLNVLPEDLLLQHVMQILSLTAFRLAPNRSFALFLQDCLPKSLLLSSNKLPSDTLERIFDNFEVPNPYLAGQDESAVATTSANFVPSPQRVCIVKKQKAAAKEALQKQKDLAMKQAQEKAEEKAKAKAKADSDKAHAKSTAAARDFIPGFPSSMSLTQSQPVVASRTKNSLLMGRDGNLARSRFVGSHFNTNLTNASTLFRQVQVSDRRQQQKSASATKKKSNNNNTNNKSQSLSRKRPVPSKSTSLSSSASTSTMSSSSGSNDSQRRSQQKQNENVMPPPPAISRRVVHETPSKSKASMPRRNNIVLETPRQPARRNNSRIFASVDDSDVKYDTGRPEESNASLVAQAFRAVQQRKR